MGMLFTDLFPSRVVCGPVINCNSKLSINTPPLGLFLHNIATLNVMVSANRGFQLYWAIIEEVI